MAENSTSNPDSIPLEALSYMGAEWKYGHGKNITIIASTFAIVSVLSSSTLIRMIMKSKQRLSSTYHRILIGMSIGDIFYSIPLATFHAMSPSDVSYMVWNARGNQASCNAYGFFVSAGMYLSLCYSCSLNLYYLFKVKYNKPDSYIRTKIEPFLLGVPILIAIVFSITGLAMMNYNDSGLGFCSDSPIYEPLHCIGYEKGEVREGFTIPCGRGRNENFYYLSMIIFMFVTPIIIGALLGMLYRHVSKQEMSMARYGAGSIVVGSQGQQQQSSRRSSTGSNTSTNNNRNNSNSRAVLTKAAAYSAAYLITWGWNIVGFSLNLAEVEVPLWYAYLWYVYYVLL